MTHDTAQRRYRVLGPLEVAVDGRAVTLNGKQRDLLGMLLLRAGDVVSTDELIDELWGGEPPPTAANTLQVHVSRLRRLLEPGVLVSHPPGYVLEVEPGELDSDEFEGLVAGARTQPAEQAADTLREALGLWRGGALADFRLASFAQGEIRRLEELRAEALELRLDADLALGRHLELVPELQQLVVEHPLRERLWAQLMLALYRSGRQADALEGYRTARETLDRELGLRPGPELQRLEQAILRQDAELVAAAAVAEPRETRRFVTVVAVAAQQDGDPEVSRARSQRVLASAASLLESRGGRVEHAPGRPLFAVFGAAATGEHDVLEALRAAVEVRDARVGVVSGEALVAGTTVLAGTVLEDAARVVQEAAPGDVLVDAGARRAAPGGVDLADAGSGRWRVVAIDPAAQAIRRSFDTPLVGRGHELAALTEAFERAVATRGLVRCTLVGAPGIGKSRLAHELLTAVDGRATVRTARCRASGEGGALAPLRELAPELPDTASREETVAALRRLLVALARRQPLVLVLDDVQWADPSLLELVESFPDWLRDLPALVLLLARTDLGGEAIALAPLSAADSDELTARLAATAPADVRARVAAAAEGNPLFIEQLLAFVEAGDVTVPPTIHNLFVARLDALPDDERRVIELAAVLGRDLRPVTLAALAGGQRDLDELLQRLVARQLLEPAAGGYRFRHQLIREAAYETLPKAVRAGLHERAAGATAGLHASERDLVAAHHLELAHRYRSELGQDAAELGTHAVDALRGAARAEVFRGNARAAAPLLERAVAIERRPELLVDLGEVLRDLGDFPGARRVLDDAVATGPPAVAAHARALALWVELQSDTAAELDRVAADAREAIAVLEEADDARGLAQAWHVLAWTSFIRCRAAETEDALERSIQYARAAGSGAAVRHGIHLLLGTGVFGPLPVADGIRRCEQVLARKPEQRIAGAAYRALAGLRAMTGDFEEARALLERDRALCDELGLRLAIAGAAEIWGLLGMLSNDLELAAAKLREGLAVSEEVGATTAISTVSAFLADVLERVGDYEQAAILVRRSEETSSHDDLYAHIVRGAVEARLLDDPARAEAVVALAETTDYLNTRADVLLSLATVLARAGRDDEARAATELARALYTRKGNYAATSSPSRARQSRTRASSSSVGGTSGSR